jgi:hypothetical protein
MLNYKFRREIKIDNTKIDATLTHFPVLLKLGSSVGISSKDVRSIFDEVGANSKKIAITKSDGETQIYGEIERWDNTNKVAEIWVSKSDLEISSSADTILYLYYDNSKADDTDFIGDTQSTPAKNVWDSNFKLRSDMKDKTTSTIEDSSSNENHGTKKGANEPNQADGKIGKGQSYDGSDDKIDIASTTDFAFGTGDFTVSFWIYLRANPTSKTFWELASFTSGLLYDHTSTNTTKIYVQGTERISYSGFPTLNTWVKVDLRRSGTSLKLYFNNSEVASGTSSDNITHGASRIGGANYAADRFTNAIFDEFRISNSARSDAWIKAELNTQNDTLITWGDEEEVVVSTHHQRRRLLIR